MPQIAYIVSISGSQCRSARSATGSNGHERYFRTEPCSENLISPRIRWIKWHWPYRTSVDSDTPPPP